MSMISLMAEPVPYKPGRLQGEITDFNKHILMTELTKGIWDSMKVLQPDYLILDFYADVYFGIIRVGDSYITNKTWLFKKTPFYSTLNLRETMNLDHHYDDYMRLWKESVDAFIKKMQEEYPSIKIIVNKIHFTDTYFSKEFGEYKRITETGIFKYIDVNEINRRLDTFYRYFEDHYDVLFIDYDKDYHSDENHIWDLFYVHYTRDFYEDFTTKLLRILLEDLYERQYQKQPVFIERKETNDNLLRNSTFNLGNSFWTYWQDDFIIREPDETSSQSNYLTIKSQDNLKDTNKQIWSHAIEINTDGQQDFTISFDIKIDQLSLLDSLQIIFSLRTFNKIDSCFQNQSVWYKNLKLHHIKPIKEGSWVRVSHTFRPTEGKFLKVGPYLKRNGIVSWRNIKLEKGIKSTGWTVSYKEKTTNKPVERGLVHKLTESFSSFLSDTMPKAGD